MDGLGGGGILMVSFRRGSLVDDGIWVEGMERIGFEEEFNCIWS